MAQQSLAWQWWSNPLAQEILTIGAAAEGAASAVTEGFKGACREHVRSPSSPVSPLDLGGMTRMGTRARCRTRSMVLP